MMSGPSSSDLNPLDYGTTFGGNTEVLSQDAAEAKNSSRV